LLDLVRLDLELVRVTYVLICATAAPREVGTFRRNPVWRTIEQFVQFGFGKMLFLTNNLRRNAFAIDRIRNKDCLAGLARDSLSAEGNIDNLEFDHSHQIFLYLFLGFFNLQIRSQREAEEED
jgi:hypothetical protein